MVLGIVFSPVKLHFRCSALPNYKLVVAKKQNAQILQMVDTLKENKTVFQYEVENL